MEFNAKAGPNAIISADRKTAERINSDQVLGAIVFSSQPLEDDVLFEVKLEEKAVNFNGSGSLMLGVTSQRPDTIASLPTYLYHLPQSWIFHGGYAYWNQASCHQNVAFGNFASLNVGDRVGVLRKNTGALHVYINGKHKGSAFSGVPSGCYPALDLYGNAAAVSIVSEGKDVVVKPGMVSIVISSWTVADFKARMLATDEVSKPQTQTTTATPNKKSKGKPQDGDFSCSDRFTHKALPGFEWFLKAYPKGYGKGESSGYVSVELCVEKSGKKSSATAPSAFFSASFTSAKGESIRPISSKLTSFVGKAVCVIEKFAAREKVEKMCADDGSITLSCKIVMEAPFKHHAEALRRCFESGAYSDFKIAVENEPIEFAVHKNILSEISPVFERMLSTEFDEIKEGKVTIKEYSLDAVKAMLQFIYGDPLCFDGLEELSIDVLKLADQYDLSGLKEMCEKSLSGMVAKRNVLEFAQIADLCAANVLKQAVFQFLFDNKAIMSSDAWIKLRNDKCKLVVEIQDFIIAKLYDALSKK